MPFKKGQSGNPSGRPRGHTSLTDVLLKKMPKEEIADLIIDLLKKQDATTLRFIWNHLEGMPVQKQILSTEEDEPFEIIIKDWKDDKKED